MPDATDREATEVELRPSRVPHLGNHFRLQWEEVQNAYVLLYPEGMVKLNESAGEILSHCNGEDSIELIVAALCKKFPDANRADIQQDVLDFLADAIQQGWVYVE